jgi:hypothetical protein
MMLIAVSLVCDILLFFQNIMYLNFHVNFRKFTGSVSDPMKRWVRSFFDPLVALLRGVFHTPAEPFHKCYFPFKQQIYG